MKKRDEVANKNVQNTIRLSSFKDVSQVEKEKLQKTFLKDIMAST